MQNISKLRKLSAAALLTTLLLAPALTQAAIITTIPAGGRGSPDVESDITNTDGNPVDIRQLAQGHSVYIGNTRRGKVQLNQGSTLTFEYATLGKQLDSYGQFVLTDPGSMLTVTRGLSVGGFGSGKFDASNGSQVLANSIAIGGSTTKGTMTITGQDTLVKATETFWMGGTNNNWVKINDGAILDVYRIGDVGDNSAFIFDNGNMNIHVFDPAKLPKFQGTGNININGMVYDRTINIRSQEDLTFSDQINQQANQDLTLIHHLDQHAFKFGVGKNENGELNIENGMSLSSLYAYVGEYQNSNGLVNISGEGSSWNVKSEIYAGREGNSTINVTQGGTINAGAINLAFSTASKSILNVSGPGSTINTTSRLLIGVSGNATANISDGAIANVSSVLLADDGEGNAVLNVQGPNSQLNILGNILAGDNGQATVNIFDGATMTSNSGGIATGTVNVSGTGTKWIVGDGEGDYDGDFYIGSTRGSAEFNLTDGGTVESKDTRIANWHNSEAVATVDGQGSQWNVQTLRLGTDGKATLNILNDGIVNVISAIYTNELSEIYMDDGELHAPQIDSQTINAIVKGGSKSGKLVTGGFVYDGEVVVDDPTSVTGWEIQTVNGSVKVVSDLTRSSKELGAGAYGQGALTITNGAQVTSRRGIIGYRDGSEGTILVTGQNSQWIVDDNIRHEDFLEIGKAGTGTLNIEDGGYVNSRYVYVGGYNEGTGHLNVSGLGSRIVATERLDTSRVNKSTINISNGGEVIANEMTAYGQMNDQGTLQITGPKSHMRVYEELYVGRGGSFKATIIDGGKITAGSIALGWEGGFGHMVVTGETSKIRTGSINIGYRSTGRLDILDGAFISTGGLNVGSDKSWNSDNVSILNVDGSKTKLFINNDPNYRKIYIGNGKSKAQINVTGGASIEAGDIWISQDGHSDALLKISGIGSQVILDRDASMAWNGKLNITQGATLSVGNNFSMYQGGDITLTLLNADEQAMISIANKFAIVGSLNINYDQLTQLEVGDEFILFDMLKENSGEKRTTQESAEPVIVGAFDNISEGDILTTINGLDLIFTYQGGDGNDITVYTIPEPTTLFTLLTLAPLTLTRRKK